MRLRVVNKTRFSIFIITVLCILFLTIGFLLFQIKSYGMNTEEEPLLYTTVYGDTLWTIAEQYKYENMDIRDYIAEIKHLNKKENAAIVPGEQLLLPRE